MLLQVYSQPNLMPNIEGVKLNDPKYHHHVIFRMIFDVSIYLSLTISVEFRLFMLLYPELVLHKWNLGGSGCGTVGRMVASETSEHRFECRLLVERLFTIN